MKTFREITLEENSWSKEDLISLIKEEEFIYEDIIDITELVLDMIDSNELTNTNEKMSPKAKKEAAIKRKKPAYKKAVKLKQKCMDKNGDKVKNSNGKLTCGSDGKLKKGMSKADRKSLMKSRLKNKNKIV